MGEDGQDRGGKPLTRRQALAAGIAGIAGIAGLAAVRQGGGGGPEGHPDAGAGPERTSSGARLPVVYLPHGGGPWPFVDMGFDKTELDALAAYLRSLKQLPATPPRAILVVSAHWEEAVPTVMTAARPPMLYDYYGFPPESYTITWPAPGEPAVAARVRELLLGAGFESASDQARGFDHGTFVPLKLTYPDADVPTLQLSLKAGLDPAEHLAIGRALSPLRDEGVYIVGSGMSFHNLRAFFRPEGPKIAETFDAWLREAMRLPPRERERALVEWEKAPAARAAHPREEHLLPLMVIAGAAGDAPASLAYNGKVMGTRISAYHFG